MLLGAFDVLNQSCCANSSTLWRILRKIPLLANDTRTCSIDPTRRTRPMRSDNHRRSTTPLNKGITERVLNPTKGSLAESIPWLPFTPSAVKQVLAHQALLVTSRQGISGVSILLNTMAVEMAWRTVSCVSALTPSAHGKWL